MRKILLLLKTPPPYGGGELRAEALREYLKNNEQFIILQLSSSRSTKHSQTTFEFWKIYHFITSFFKYIQMIIIHKPVLIYLPLSKKFLALLRDSAYFWTAQLFRVHVVSELAGMAFYFLKGNKIQHFYGKLVLSKLTNLRVLSKTIAKEMKNYGIKKVHLSDNGVAVYNKAKYQPESNNNLFQILYVGTLSTQKGFNILVKALNELLKRGYSLNLHALGEWISPEFESFIKKYITMSELWGKIVFHGLKFGKEKWDIYSNSQILVLPSFSEGQPLTILEGLGCGIPIVSTRVGGIPEIIVDGVNGYLIDPGSIEQLSDSIEKLLLDKDLRVNISNANIALYKKRFTIEKYLESQVRWLLSCLDYKN